MQKAQPLAALPQVPYAPGQDGRQIDQQEEATGGSREPGTSEGTTMGQTVTQLVEKIVEDWDCEQWENFKQHMAVYLERALKETRREAWKEAARHIWMEWPVIQAKGNVKTENDFVTDTVDQLEIARWAK